MRNITIDNITDAVIQKISPDVPERNREIMTSLIKHMHAFCKEVKLTHEEWLKACDYFVEAGSMSDDKRNEFILLSDIIGVEVLVDMLDHKVTHGESESTVLGPFYRDNPPVLPKGATIVQKDFENSESIYVEGSICSTDGTPIEGVTIDVWEDAPNGLYEQQDPDQPDYNLRGRFETDAEGNYAFRALRPMPYPIPYDGPAGDLLKFMDRHPWRPGHIHFLISKDGYQPLISQIYDRDTKYLDDDSVFAVKESLIGDFIKAPDELNVDLYMKFDFKLKPLSVMTAAE